MMTPSSFSMTGRLIAIAMATTGIASATAAFGQEPEFERPIIEAISIGADTVWFCGSVNPTDEFTIYMWLRGTREWRRADASVKAPCANGRPMRLDISDTVRAARGLTFVRIRPKPDSEGISIGRSYLRLIDSTNGRTVDLRPAVDTRLIRKLSTYSLESDTVSTDIGGVAVEDSVLWIGLRGGFPEGTGAYGGVYRVDRRTGAYEWIVDSRLAEHTITGAASVGRWIWFGTQNPAEFGPYGNAGLLRLDGSTREWRQYTDSTSPLPDALVRAMESDGKILALATEKGLAVVELHAPGAPSAARMPGEGDESIARWNVAYFVPAFVGDSMVFDLGSKAQAPLRESEAAFTIAQRFAHRGREKSFYTAVAKLPAKSLAEAAYGDVEAGAKAIADTSLVQVLVPLLSFRGDGQLFAAFVLGDLGTGAPKEAVDAMRAAFFAMDTVHGEPRLGWYRSRVGRVLTAMGDSSAVRWARTALDSAIRRKAMARGPARSRMEPIDVGSAAAILANAHDRLGLTLIIGVVPPDDEYAKQQVVQQLAQYDEPLAWGALIAFGRGRQLPAMYVYEALQPSALNDPTVAARLRDYIRLGLSDSTGDRPFRATAAVDRLRLIEFAPMLVSRLEPGRLSEGYLASRTVAALVSLSGRGDAPVFVDSLLPPRSTFDWWQQWLAAQNGKLVAVPQDVGSKAASAWYRRSSELRRGK